VSFLLSLSLSSLPLALFLPLFRGGFDVAIFAPAWVSHRARRRPPIIPPPVGFFVSYPLFLVFYSPPSSSPPSLPLSYSPLPLRRPERTMLTQREHRQRRDREPTQARPRQGQERDQDAPARGWGVRQGALWRLPILLYPCSPFTLLRCSLFVIVWDFVVEKRRGRRPALGTMSLSKQSRMVPWGRWQVSLRRCGAPLRCAVLSSPSSAHPSSSSCPPSHIFFSPLPPLSLLPTLPKPDLA
jgi:hypothetical protein